MNHILLSSMLIAAFPAYGMEVDEIDHINVCFDKEKRAVRAWTEQETEDGEHVILTTASREICKENEFTVYAIQSDAKKDGVKNTRIKQKVEPDTDTVDRLKNTVNWYIKKKIADTLNG